MYKANKFADILFTYMETGIEVPNRIVFYDKHNFHSGLFEIIICAVKFYYKDNSN